MTAMLPNAAKMFTDVGLHHMVRCPSAYPSTHFLCMTLLQLLYVVSHSEIAQVVRKCLHILIAMLSSDETLRYVQDALFAALTRTTEHENLFSSVRDRLHLAAREFEDRITLRALQEKERNALEDDVLSACLPFSPLSAV